MNFPAHTIGPIGPETLALFSAAQRDFNPIHLSDSAARAAGFDGAIVHGMYILGQFEALVRSLQPEPIMSLNGRFLRPVTVGSALTLTARLVGQVEGAKVLRLLARSQEGTLVAIGEARLRTGL